MHHSYAAFVCQSTSVHVDLQIMLLPPRHHLWPLVPRAHKIYIHSDARYPLHWRGLGSPEMVILSFDPSGYFARLLSKRVRPLSNTLPGLLKRKEQKSNKFVHQFSKSRRKVIFENTFSKSRRKVIFENRFYRLLASFVLAWSGSHLH